MFYDKKLFFETQRIPVKVVLTQLYNSISWHKFYKAKPYKFLLDSILKRPFFCTTLQSPLHAVKEIQRSSSEHPHSTFMQIGVTLPLVHSKVGFTENETNELKVQQRWIYFLFLVRNVLKRQLEHLAPLFTKINWPLLLNAYNAFEQHLKMPYDVFTLHSNLYLLV